ncbi:MAG: uncharacterized protein JWR62_1350 [Modestobacter sp.]|nr:uncharacterized protein [Modestobacter sp.]
MRARGAVGAVALLTALLTGCATGVPPTSGLGGLPPGSRIDYQLGGAHPPAAGVAGVVRDRTDGPAPGLWSACYVNAFQTQPGAGWPEQLLLHGASGARVEDPEWPGEFLLDVSTADRRRAVLDVIGPQLDGCAAAGFDAVEPDNLDSWTRSGGLLTAADAAAAARLLVARAHDAGLAVAQKNAPELAGLDLGFDYAVAEDCQRYDECSAYTAAYGGAVLEVEYTDRAFAAACRLRGDAVSVVRRDAGVTPPGDPDYVAAWCPSR